MDRFGRGPGQGRGAPPVGGGPGRKPTEENPNAVRITAENATFLMKNDLLYMAEPRDAAPVRVVLHRNFPFEYLWEYLSVLNTDGYELASIRTLDDFPGEAGALLRAELERKYYAPVIRKILSVKERFGFSYWDVETEAGKQTFTLQDTFRSIVRVGDGRLFLLDVDGNRFVIPDVAALDRRSARKIEIYL